jgi:hypothetical protein
LLMEKYIVGDDYIPSEYHVFLAAETLITYFDLPYLMYDVWKMVYPDSPITEEEWIKTYLDVALDVKDFDPRIPDNVESVFYDLQRIGHKKVADKLRELIHESLQNPE